MAGSALVRLFTRQGFTHIIKRSHDQLDLTCQQQVRDFFSKEQIDFVILAAAKVGGIHANNSYPADFIATNLQIECNVILEAHRANIQHLLFLGSSCIYPRHSPQPIKEEYLLTGALEPTNKPYAVAKIAGITLCESLNRQYGRQYLSVMPTNLYGPGDTFHLEHCHVIPAMLRKYHLAKMAARGDYAAIKADEETFGEIPENVARDIGLMPDRTALQKNHPPKVVLWGSGTPFREFLHVDDMAAACIHILSKQLDPQLPLINIGTGQDQTIRKIAEHIASVVGFTGETHFDLKYPDGTPRKLLDTSLITSLGWKPTIQLSKGLKSTYTWYLSKIEQQYCQGI